MLSAELAGRPTSRGIGSERPPRVLLVGATAESDLSLAFGEGATITYCAPRDAANASVDTLDVAVVDCASLEAPIAGAEPIARLALRLPTLVVGNSDQDALLETFANTIGGAATMRRPVVATEVVRLVGTLTELRRCRRAVAVTNAALDHSTTGLAIADPTREGAPLVYVSPAFERLTGYTAAEALERSCAFLQGAATDAATIAQLRAAVRARTPGRFVLRNYKRDGTPFWNELTLFPVFDEGGEVLYLGGLQHDVTDLVTARAELARAKDELAARQELTRDVLDGVPLAVVTTDEAFRVTLINRAACALVETTPERCIGAHVEGALSLPPSAVTGLVGEGRRGESAYTVGGAVPREIGLSLRQAAGEHGYFIVLRDLAESRHAERIERLAAVSSMAAGFAHEVRNPLASLRMLCEMLQIEVPRDDPHQELIARMMQQVARVERLVRTSLQFARPQKPRIALHWPSVIVNTVLEALAPRLRGAGGELNLAISEGLPKVECDDAQLVQVLVILANNALEATGRAAGVTLRVAPLTETDGPRRSWVRFSVEDDGPGVPEHLRAAVFHPFFTTKPQGTGLGLSIAQQIIHENGGRIELGTKADRGAVFSVLIRGGNES